MAAAPQGLGKKAKAVWSGITGDFDLRVDELRVLEDACREVDLIERIDEELKTADLIVKGSMGQPVASPLVMEIRQHRVTLARLFGSLKLPADAEGGSEQGERSSSARQAAMTRWGRGASA